MLSIFRQLVPSVTLLCLLTLLGVSPTAFAYQAQGKAGPSKDECTKQGGTAEDPGLGRGDDWYACCHALPTPVNGNTKVCSICKVDGSSCSNIPVYRAKLADGGGSIDDSIRDILLGMLTVGLVSGAVGFAVGWLVRKPTRREDIGASG